MSLRQPLGKSRYITPDREEYDPRYLSLHPTLTHLHGNCGGIGRMPYSLPVWELLDKIPPHRALHNLSEKCSDILSSQYNLRRMEDGIAFCPKTYIDRKTGDRKIPKIATSYCSTVQEGAQQIQSYAAVWWVLFELNNATLPPYKLTDPELSEVFAMFFPESRAKARSARYYRQAFIDCDILNSRQLALTPVERST